MRKYLNFILTALIIASTSIIAFAEITNAGGGIWDHGVNHNPGGLCWSKYNHPDKRHGSTAMNGDGDWDEDDGVDSGTWSNAKIDATDHGNKAYWHRCGIDKNCGYDQD